MTNQNNVNILGISFGHGDSSAALICGNKLVAAAEEERFTRIKHTGEFPFQSIDYCLSHASIKPSQVHKVIIARKPSHGIWKRIQLGMNHPEWFRRWFNTPRNSLPSLTQNIRKAGLQRAKILRCEHHVAHIMSAAGIHNEPSAFLSFDGLGDFTSTVFGSYKPSSLKINRKIFFPHSLGYFYSAMTQHLGFPYFGDEFKVMGLSSYGEPRYLKAMHELIREDEANIFALNLEAFPFIEKPIDFRFIENQPHVIFPNNSAFITQVTGVPFRKPGTDLLKMHWDLAKSVQIRFEEIANNLLKKNHENDPHENLLLSGGCAHNSVWVGKIPNIIPYKKITVAPASNDAGLAVGAAIWAAKNKVDAEDNSWALLGPHANEFANYEDRSLGKTFTNEDEIIRVLVEKLIHGKIIGLFHGRLEFGPRALGSRSIICDPRSIEMKHRLNARVKHRELFRPFAASVLFEQQSHWFKDSFYSPHMEAVFPVHEALREKIGAVTHVDGTCRIQSVTKESQPFYWKLIRAFFKATSIPMLVNTSFNDCEPIVCSPEDAIRCFKETEMDYLLIENTLFDRDCFAEKLKTAV